MRTMTRWALTPFAVLALAGCGDKADKTGAETPTANAPAAAPSRTLAATLQADGANGALARLMTNSGLDAALAGVGPYTLFAPAESVLKGQAAADVTDPAMKAEGAALLRAHIVPGALTRADIAAAVDRSAGQGAQMRTMAGGLLTFMRNGQAERSARLSPSPFPRRAVRLGCEHKIQQASERAELSARANGRRYESR